ncbi:hypothetical protein [[Ruminococcus] lactaris]|uniref:hypothetical protein n=1 Tax=[Ruminococcus] lactaris TaxID=46228 RepID=UPI00266595BC|nr:hypothetical protein [[Ruminococcus] lactaris]
MKKLSRKLAAGFLALAMVLTTALPYLPSIDVFAASKTMAHIVSGAENGNGHFGSATPEAFALSPDATFTNEDFSSTLKLGSAQSDTRARVVLKYKDDSNWAYIGYDGAGSATDWIYEYNNNGTSSYGSVAGLPQVTVVKTGDSGAPIGIFVVLAIVAAGAVVVVVLRMKADQKKNAKKKHRNRPDGTR